jgi:hypothetical protein
MASKEKEVLSLIVTKMNEVLGEVEKIKGKSTYAKVSALISVLPEAIRQVELLGKELVSVDKKKLAVEACITYYDIKLLPNAIERKILGAIVDVFVSMLNKWFGDNWGSVVSGVLGKVLVFLQKIVK